MTDEPDRAAPSPGALDALMPPEIARRAVAVGEAKVGMATVPLLALAVLAGAFIALGAMFSTTVATGGGEMPWGVSRLLAGLAFSLGLILVVVAGAELFTGNNLIVMARAEGRVGWRGLARNWGLVYLGNLAGAVATAALVFASGQYEFGDPQVGTNALAIAESKAGLDFGRALALGALCNALVCLAVWLSYGARSLTDKVLAVIFPITAFVAAGFEHSVANMYFLPVGLMVKEEGSREFFDTAGVAPADYPDLTLSDAIFSNLLPVTIGNVIGGSLMVGLVYWLVYLRPRAA